MRQIIINATAACYSGALTIIKDFMSYVYENGSLECQLHLLTTTEGVFHNVQNVIVHELPVQNWRTRLVWDKRGFQKWCEINDIFPDTVISFQNTCPRLTGKFRNVKLLVYYHQQLPLVKYPWKCYRSDERKLFLYAHFYGFFVNRWNKNAEYVVQLPSVKELFCKKFPNIKSENVHVIRPNLPKIDIDALPKKHMHAGKKVFIYPATPLRYKNHIVILKALDYLRKENSKILGQLKVIFTVPKNSFVADTVRKMKLDSFVDCIESIPYEELLSYYKSSSALLFPSKIESFGLPLIEAALFGIPIVASDLPYAREVLEKYENSAFINSDDCVSFANAIKEVCMTEKQLKPMIDENINAWEQFEQLMLYL